MYFDKPKVGDICAYSFDDKNMSENKSRSIVEIVKVLDDERGIAEIKFHNVFVDDSGNDYFTYLLKTGHTMNASFKYLKVIFPKETDAMSNEITKSVWTNTITANRKTIKEIRIVYLWYTHLNPEVTKNTKEIDKAIDNHDWEYFSKWLEWQKNEKLLYFPDGAEVYIDGEYMGDLILNESNFHLITVNDHECG